jgi:zinc transporter, ZIP family
MNLVHLLLGAATAMLATMAGAACILALSRVNSRFQALTIAFSAGMMAFAAFEMIDEAQSLGGHRPALVALIAGMLVFLLLDKALPHAHLMLLGNEMPSAKRKAALLAGAIAIHNIPEGIAIAAAFASNTSLGWLVAISIAMTSRRDCSSPRP